MPLICAKFDRRLQRLMDQRLNPARDPRLARHAASCAHCRRSLDGHMVLFSELGERFGPPSAERAAALDERSAAATRISDRVLAKQQTDAFQLGAARRRRRLFGAMAAALLFAAFWQASHWQGPGAWLGDRLAKRGSRQAPSSIIPPSMAPLAVARSSSSQPALPTSATSAVLITERKLASLAQETGQGLATVTRLLPGLRPVRPALLDRPGESLDPAGRAKNDADPAWGALGDWIDFWPSLAQDSRS